MVRMRTRGDIMTSTNTVDKESLVRIEAMRGSAIHGLEPRNAAPEWIDFELIYEDPTNPGLTTASLRDKRREPSIKDSYDILGSVIYPGIVSESVAAPGRFTLIDGHGRYRELNNRGEKRMKAFV